MQLLLGLSFVELAYAFLSIVAVALVIAFGVGRWSNYVPPSGGPGNGPPDSN